MLKLEKTIEEVQGYDGTVYKLSRPSYRQQADYSKSLEGKADADQSECLLDLLEACGLPKEVSMEMEGDHVLQIINKLIPPKKK